MKIPISSQYEIQEARSDFYKEIKWLASKHGVKESQIVIDSAHPTGEICIFIKGVWYGYIDVEFYKMMDGLESMWDY